MGWLSGWSYRKSHIIAGTAAGAQTDYPVKITVHYGAGVDAGEDVYCNSLCQTDFDDIRFTKPDGVTELDYKRESYTDSTIAVFWVEVDSIPASPGSATICVYYGNGAVTTTSDGDATFTLNDDFTGVALDPAKWTSAASGGSSSVTVAGGIVTIKSLPAGAPGGYALIKSVGQWVTGYAIRALASYCPHSPSYLQYGGISWSLCEGSGVYPIWGSADFCSHMIRGSAFEWQAYKKDGGSVIYQTCALTEATYQIYENRRTESGSTLFQVLEEGGASTSYGAGFETAALNIGASVEQSAGLNNRTMTIDWLVVRKFVTPEPSHDAWGPQVSEGSPINLKAGFFVNAFISASRALAGGLTARHAASSNISALFATRRTSLSELGSRFEVGQDAGELSTEFIVRHGSSSNLKAGFDGQAVQSLPAELKIRHEEYSAFKAVLISRHSASGNLKAGLKSRHQGDQNFSGSFIARHASTQDLGAGFSGQAVRRLSSEFIVRHVASSDLLGKTKVRHSDILAIPGQFITRHSASQVLRAGMRVIQWRNLLSGFIVRHYAIHDLAMGFFVNQYNAQADLKTGFYAYPLNQPLLSGFYVRPLESTATELMIKDLTRGLIMEDADRELTIKRKGRRLRIY